MNLNQIANSIREVREEWSKVPVERRNIKYITPKLRELEKKLDSIKPEYMWEVLWDSFTEDQRIVLDCIRGEGLIE